MDSSGHAVIEKNMGLLIVLIIVAISFGGLVEIVPLFFQKSTTEPVAGLKPYSALELSGGTRRPTPAPWEDLLSPPTDPRGVGSRR